MQFGWLGHWVARANLFALAILALPSGPLGAWREGGRSAMYDLACSSARGFPSVAASYFRRAWMVASGTEWSARGELHPTNKRSMSNTSGKTDNDEFRPEYDFSDGEQGKYAARFAEGTNLVILQPEMAKAFPDSQAVNDALRSLPKSDKPKRGRGSA